MAVSTTGFYFNEDYITIFRKLTDDEAGRLLKHAIAYSSGEDAELEDRILQVLFEPIKNQLDREGKGRKQKKDKANRIKPVEDNTDELKKKYDTLAESFNGMDKKTIYEQIKEFITTNNPMFIEPYADIWNVVASIYNLSSVEHLTEQRKDKIRLRLKEPGFDFFKILTVIRKDKFYLGENNNGWKVSFDHIIQSPTNWVKIQEKFTG